MWVNDLLVFRPDMTVEVGRAVNMNNDGLTDREADKVNSKTKNFNTRFKDSGISSRSNRPKARLYYTTNFTYFVYPERDLFVPKSYWRSDRMLTSLSIFSSLKRRS